MSHLIALDFDGTIAKTFAKAPSGIGVNEAYDIVIRQIFGNRVFQFYTDHLKGHQNRSPSELVTLLLRKDGIETPDPEEVMHISEHLVQEKLALMLDQIGQASIEGTVWPQPTNNFLYFWHWLTQESNLPLKTAIISSGHEAFIRKTFNAWGVKQPDYLVTEDDIRQRKYPKELTRRVKPGPFPFAYVHRQWLNDNTITESGHSTIIDSARYFRERILYIGDDSAKDGGLARLSSVPFGHFKENEALQLSPADNQFTFGDWQDFTSIIAQKSELIRRGSSFRDILFASLPRKENEYPHLIKHERQ